MKFYIIIIFISNLFFSQKTHNETFDLNKFNELYNKSCPMDCDIKTYYNKNSISFKRNDSTVNMSYLKDGISSILKEKGNYYVYYTYHPNLKIKCKTEFIQGVSQSGSLQVNTELEFDENRKVIKQFDWNKIPFDENVPAPNKNIWEIVNQVKKECNFDILNDKLFFSIQQFQDEKSKKVNYKISKFISDDDNKLRLLQFIYDGANGSFIKNINFEKELPEGGLVHY